MPKATEQDWRRYDHFKSLGEFYLVSLFEHRLSLEELQRAAQLDPVAKRVVSILGFLGYCSDTRLDRVLRR